VPSRRKLVVFGSLVVIWLFGIVWAGFRHPYSFIYEGPSMNPGLTSGDRVAVRGYTFGGSFPAPEVRAGNIVVARSTADGVLVIPR
jgi:signal peptidase I